MDTNTLAYFNKEASQFIQLLGDKKAWADKCTILRAAKKALCHLYFNLRLPETDQQRADDTWQALMIDMTHRAALMNQLNDLV